jgi:Zn-dependent protease with chaperone function
MINHLALFLFVLAASIQFAWGGAREIELNLSPELERILLGNPFTLRKAPNIGLFLYASLEGKDYVIKHKPSGIFPNSHDIPEVAITKISTDSETEVISRKYTYDRGRSTMVDDVSVTHHYWVFRLNHQYLGRGEIRITTGSGELPSNANQVCALLGFTMKGRSLPEPAMFRARNDSKMVHFVCSGHQPIDGNYKDFASLDAARSAGFTPCLLCFNQRLILPHIQEEMLLGKEIEANIRHYYPVLIQPAYQSQMTKVGAHVLANWPTRLQGYNYRFSVIDNGSFNAVACPGGYVFVNKGLMDTIEDEGELEAVLAHEIAHCEQRHGIKEFVKRRQDARTTAATVAVVAGISGVALAANGQAAMAQAQAATAITAIIAELAYQTVQQGYSKEHEKEADVLALIYLQKQNKDAKHLVSILKKVRSSREMDCLSNGDSLSDPTHPSPAERLYMVQNIQTTTSLSNMVYDAYNKAGELLYTISLDAQCRYRQRDGRERTELLAQVHTTAALGKAVPITGMYLQKKPSPIYLKCDGKTELQPLEDYGVSFTSNNSENPLADLNFIPSLEGISEHKVVLRNLK